MEQRRARRMFVTCVMGMALAAWGSAAAWAEGPAEKSSEGDPAKVAGKPFACAQGKPEIGSRGAELYVSPQGDDCNPGTKDKPFATPAQAREAVRALKKAGAAKGGVTVFLRGGTYVLKEPFTLQPEDSGEPGAPVVYAAAPGETPIISGGRSIAGWRRLTDEIPGLAAEARGKLWVADVPKGWLFHYLFINGARQMRAARPETDDWRQWPTLAGAGKREPVVGQLLRFPPGTLDNIAASGDVEMCLLPTYRFMNDLSVLADIDAANSTARRKSRNVTYPALAGDPFRIENALAVLDKPGEWCVDSSAGKVYYWPPDGTMKDVEAIAPALMNLVRFQGREESGPWVHHVELRGLTFTYTDRLPEDRWPEDWLVRDFVNPDAALFLQGVEHCAITGCRIVDVGTYAIALDRHAIANRVVGNEMAYLGCGGVQMNGYGPGTTDVNHDNVVSRNHIHHTGLAPYWHSLAIAVYGSGKNEFIYNYIHDLPYSGISIVGCDPSRLNRIDCQDADAFGTVGAQHHIRWNELPAGSYERYLRNAGTFTPDTIRPYLHSGDTLVENNVLMDVMQVLDDGGALYAWSCGLGNVWRNNIIRNVRAPEIYFPIYMDDVVDGALIEGNEAWSPGYNCNKGSNDFRNNTVTTSRNYAYVRLLTRIVEEVKRQGGWPGNPKPFDLPDLTPRPVPDGWLDSGAAFELHRVEADDKGTIGFLNHRSYVAFGPYDFADGAVEAAEAVVSGLAAGASSTLHVRLDALDGPMVGTFVFGGSSASPAPQSYITKLRAVKGAHMVYLIHGADPGPYRVGKVRFLKQMPANQ